MAKYTKEQLAQMKEQVKLKKEAESAAYKKEMLEKSAIFRKLPGKILKMVTIIGLVLSVLYLVDIFLSPKYTEQTVVSAEEEILRVVTNDGYYIPVKYYWVYLNEQKDFGVFMFHGDYEIIENSGKLEIASSPIFSIPTGYRVTSEIEFNEKNFEKDIPYTRMLPITILIICLLWVLMNPADNIQFIIYGYFAMFVIPILLTIFLVSISGNFQEKGLFKMDIKDLRLKAPIEVRY
jgi:hypothetical protein